MIAPEFSRPLKADGIGTAPRDVAVEASPEERAALAVRFVLLALDSLSADLSVKREAAGVRVTGRVKATATQSCVISAEPVPAEVDTPLDLLFAPETDRPAEEEVELSDTDLDVLPFDGQSIDLGEAVAQTFGLALDPYPRARGAEVEAVRALLSSEEEAAAARSPFAALKRP